MRLVGFIIRIYHVTRSHECQIKIFALILYYSYTNLFVYNWVRPSVYVYIYIYIYIINCRAFLIKLSVCGLNGVLFKNLTPVFVAP